MAQNQEEHLPRVLVADDDQSIRQLVSTIVKRERFAVDVAADGLEAIEYLKKHQYAVILLDLMMREWMGSASSTG
jgi:CheY-like chemotaxis protein